MGHATRARAATPLPGADVAAPGDIYEIVVGVRLSRRWADGFDGFAMIDPGDGTTVLRGAPHDQSTLFGALGRVRDLGAPLLAVRRVTG
jgi:hypothetical protein